MSARDIVLFLIGIIGIVTAIAGAIAQKIAAMDWAMPLVATSVVAFWAAFILYAHAARRNHEQVTGALAVLDGHMLAEATVANGPGTSIERGALVQLLRSGAFNSRIDPELWARFGSDLLGDVSTPDTAKLATAARALSDSMIEVGGQDRVYSYMHTLLRSIHHRGQSYRAITTPHELAKDQAKKFILQLSKLYPGIIQRVLVVPHDDALKELPAEVRSALREVNNVVAMRYFVMADEQPRNFGIYGEIAVGVLDEQTGRNSFIFRGDVVKERNSEFGALWAAAEPLHDTLLPE